MNSLKSGWKVVRLASTALVTISIAAIAGGIFWFALADESRPKELALIATLAITVAAVILASLATAFVHKLIYPQAPDHSNGDVFRESIRRFAWLSAPIAAGYGISQVVTGVARIVAD